MGAMLIPLARNEDPDGGLQELGLRVHVALREYGVAWTQSHVQFVRSLWYGAVVTIVTLVAGYPAAYWIAFKAGTTRPPICS
jgi:spermidine/putrescine transport system permease protein